MTRQVALIYVRKSMVRSKSDEQSPIRQRALCIAECERRGWIHEVYPDAEGHRSGRSEKHRPAFRRLKRQLVRPDIVAVVVSRLDRLSRSPKDFFNLLSLLQKHQVELVSLREQFDTTTAIGKAFVSIIMVIAALEADLASERTAAALEFRRSQGIHVGNAPFGFSRDEDGVLAPDQDAPAAHAVLETYATGKHSFQSVANRLNTTPMRFRDRYGNRVPFTKSRVRSIVSNVLIYRGRIPNTRGKEMSLPDELNGSHDLVRQMSEIYQAEEGQVEPIITPALAERVLQARFQRHQPQGRPHHMYVLTPILHCATCGDLMYGYTHRNTPFYRHKGPSCNPGYGQHHADPLERQALGLFRSLTLPPGLVDLIEEKAQARLQQQPENQDAKRALTHLDEKMSRLQELYLEQDINRQDYLTRKAAIQAQIAEWSAEMSPMNYSIPEICGRLSNLSETLGQSTREQQKQIISAVFDRIEVNFEGKITRAEPKPWFQPLFVDLAAVLYSGELVCPQGNSNPCRHLERVVS